MSKSSGRFFTTLMTALLAVFGMELIHAVRAEAGGSVNPGIKIQLLSNSERVVPLYYRHGDYWCTHLRTPDILVENVSGSEITLGKITVIGKAAGREAARVIIHGDEIAGLAARSARVLNGLLSDRNDAEKIDRMGRLYGNPAVMKPEYCSGAAIPPKGFAALSLSEASYFFHEGLAKIDEIAIEVETSREAAGSAVLELRLDGFTSANEYHYPVKGSSMAGSVPFGHSHRFGNGQEFAIDIMDLRRFDDGSFSTCSIPNPRVIMGSPDVKDYYIYGREVLAMADGEVIEVASSFPDEMASNPQDFFSERVPRITPELLSRGVKPANITGGNFVLIDHGNGEFARYCHLREGIPVREGDRVTRAQVIGYVGNSGNSAEPHLHVELLDSADYTTANGLPILFSDLSLGSVLDSPTMGERNSLVFSEFIFINAR